MNVFAGLALVGLLGVSVAGCSQTAGPREAGSTVLGAGAGAITGGLIGGAIGGSGGAAIGAVTGGLFGGVVGNSIGRDLDERDRAAAMDAQYAAFESGQRRPWRGQRAYGYVEPGPEYVESRGTCRSYSHRIYIDGRPASAQGVACRRPDGTWQPVA